MIKATMNKRNSLRAPRLQFGALHVMLFGVILSLTFLGCGTDHPFDRGPDFDDGTVVVPPGPGDGVSFSFAVMPILETCVSCHAGGTGGWKYDGGPDAYNQAIQVVDIDDPESSLMLIKGSGGANHGGGQLFSVNSDEYDTILAWIEDGAPDN